MIYSKDQSNNQIEINHQTRWTFKPHKPCYKPNHSTVKLWARRSGSVDSKIRWVRKDREQNRGFSWLLLTQTDLLCYSVFFCGFTNLRRGQTIKKNWLRKKKKNLQDCGVQNQCMSLQSGRPVAVLSPFGFRGVRVCFPALSHHLVCLLSCCKQTVLATGHEVNIS